MYTSGEQPLIAAHAASKGLISKGMVSQPDDALPKPCQQSSTSGKIACHFSWQTDNTRPMFSDVSGFRLHTASYRQWFLVVVSACRYARDAKTGCKAIPAA